jgi:hypothetical protein
VLKLKPGELRLHLRNLHVAPADSWHQPVELPDGTVLWRSNSHGGLNRHQHCSFVELDSSEPQSCNEASASSESECTAGDDKEIGAVGGRSLTSQTLSSIEGEQKQEGETENDEEREVEEGECKIDILNNDCLMHIFSFLTKRERIKMERGMLFQVFLSYMAFYSLNFCDLPNALRLACLSVRSVSFRLFKFLAAGLWPNSGESNPRPVIFFP